MTRHFTKYIIAVSIISFTASCKKEATDFAADFEADMTDIGIGQYVNFEDESIGGVTAYEWTFDGGEPSSSDKKNPSAILYTTAGTFDVTLTITTEDGTSTETKEGYIKVEQLAGGCESTTSVTDIDGNTYSVVTIGSQCWLGENLKVTKFKDGSEIPVVTNDSIWKASITPAMTSYNNDNANDEVYGKLYNWFAANDPKGLCPEGWRLPHDNDFRILTEYLDPEDEFAGGRLKEAGTEHWESPNDGANNSSGFTGLPGGMRFREGMFDHINRRGIFWSSRPKDDFYGYFLMLTYDTPMAHRTHLFKQSGFSCRCIKE